MNKKKLACLENMGIEIYVPRGSDLIPAAAVTAERQDTNTDKSAAESIPDTNTWNLLQQEVSCCTKCSELVNGRTQTVFGVGNIDAEWMLIGEAPGMEEDRRGEPFVGRAGKLLDKMLNAIGFDRNVVYITNILKCRPPENRNPRPDEAENCSGYLRRQIALVNPKLILALGGVAASNLLGVQTPVGQLRGREHRLPDSDIPLVVTYHPAYLLRSPNQKRAAWDDLQFACRVAGRELK